MFEEPVLAGHTVKRAGKEKIGIVVESQSDATEHKLQLQSASVFEPSSDTRSTIKRPLAHFNAFSKRHLSYNRKRAKSVNFWAKSLDNSEQA